MSERHDERVEEWPPRPWIMAAICALAGLLFHFLTEHSYPETISPSRQAGATFVAIAAVSFVLTVERRRWTWAVGFALGWALVIAFVGWFTASYNREDNIFEWPFLSGVFAVMLAAPLFQTVRDEGAWRFPYRRLHSHAWTDAVIGAASLVFTGITFLLAWLIAGLFDVIGIDLIKDLLEEEWFAWTLAGFAFGAAVGLLRERDRLVATLQKLVMVVFSVLAPVLAVALVLFLLSIPFTGLERLWDSWVSATGLLLAASAGAILLANAVIGDGREQRSSNRVLHQSALALVAAVLPLAILAGLAMGIRIDQYGWTPERMWGAVAVAVAIAYGLGGWWAIWRGRRDFDDPLRPLQTRVAIGLCAVALLLALPIFDFGAISARSQVARLQSGAVEPDRFDWAALAFDFGPEGREALTRLARSGPAEWRDFAASALRSKERWALAEQVRAAEQADDVAGRVRALSAETRLTPELMRHVALRHLCPEQSQCALLSLGGQRYLLVASHGSQRQLQSAVVDLAEPSPFEARPAAAEPPPPSGVDLDTARIEVRAVPRRQLFVNGAPVGEPFE